MPILHLLHPLYTLACNINVHNGPKHNGVINNACNLGALVSWYRVNGRSGETAVMMMMMMLVCMRCMESEVPSFHSKF